MAKKLQLLRNSSTFTSKVEALGALEAQLAKLLVGEPAIVWYTENGETKVILGISAGNSKYQIFDTEAIPSEVQEILDRLDGEEGVEGSVKNLIKAAIEKLDKADSAVTNQYVSAVSEDNGIITVSRKQLVGTDDKVIAFNDGGITSTIKLKKVTDGLQGTEKEKYQLVGIGDEVLGDVITINKDQSFKGAKLIEKGEGEPPIEEDTLRLTYVDGSGTDINVDIPLGSFLREAEFKNGLTVSGNGEVSVKLGETSSKENFLIFEGETDGQKSLAVREIKTDATKISKKIPVAGGPLADLVDDVYPDGIEAGTDMQTVLMNLLCKEIYPNATVAQGKLTSAFAKPNVTVSNNEATIEVGTKVTVNAFTAYEATPTPTARKYSNFTYGYSLADDDTMDQAGNPADVQVSEVAVNTGTYTITRTYTGFTGSQATTTQSGDTASSVTIPLDNTAITQEGSNTVKFDISGPGHKGKVVSSPEYFIVSNLGNTDSIKKVAAQDEQTLNVASATAASTTYTITGRYKYFLGYSTKQAYSDFDSASVRALTVKSGWISGQTQVVSATSPIKSDGTSIVIACPTKYQLKKITNGLGADILANFSSKGTVSVTTGAISTDYTVYVYPISNGAEVEFKDVVIG